MNFRGQVPVLPFIHVAGTSGSEWRCRLRVIKLPGCGPHLRTPYGDRIVDVMEEQVRFTVLMRPHAALLVDRYSERKEAGVNAFAEDHAPVAIIGR